MLKNSARRWLAGLGVAGAFVAASATPAFADEAFELNAPNVLVPVGHTAYSGFWFDPADGDAPFEHATIDLDLSAVADFVQIEPNSEQWRCTSDAPRLHCEADAHPEWGIGDFTYFAISKDGVEPGRSGDMTVKATAGGSEVTKKVTLTLAEAVDLQSPEQVDLEAAPGESFGVQLNVRNAGPSAAKDVVMMLWADYYTAYTGNFSNCRYSDGNPVICHFDSELDPEKTYRLSSEVPLKLADEVRSGTSFDNSVTWWTTDDWNASGNDEYFSDIKPGTGEPLRLVEVEPTARRAAPQTDIEWSNNVTTLQISVGGNHYADLAAEPVSAGAAAGKTIAIRPTVRNLGPAIAEATWNLTEPVVEVVLPGGTTAVEAPGDCAPITEKGWNIQEDWGQPGATRYGCLTSEIAPGQTYSFDFTLKVDKVTPNAPGQLTVTFPADPQAGNNTAEIVLKPASAGNGGGDDNGQGGGAGDGGSLPITGSSTGLIAGIGALLLVAGAGGYLVARRRRTRFVA
ncbi:LPXTG cell wall anchor domain-containing protein [Micromonospora costi]|uniref:LPXTG cell wall anchor domain-containing protein n=1 Tax=Micromonospora costi TaxID=1530042 RepID=UPI0033E31AD5